jgi:hypothetical protein
MLASTITPDAPAATRAFELRQRPLRILPRQRGEPAQPIGMRGARRRHVVVHDARSFEAHLRTAPIAVRAGQRDDADVDADFVHRANAQIVVEHRRHGRHERRAVEMDGAHAACHGAHRVARAAMALQQREPRLGEAVGVDVDDRARHESLRLTRR